MIDVKAKWIAADWGTTHMRAWAIDEQGEVLAYSESNDCLLYTSDAADE